MQKAKLIFTAAVAAQLIFCSTSRAQDDGEIKPDPAAHKAFAELVQAYRERPALTVTSTLKIEMTDDGAASNGSEIKGEFTFGQHRNAVIKMRDFTVYLHNDPESETDPEKENSGTLTAVHEKTDHSYFTTSDDGSPYYALLNAFKDLPFPILAVELGEDAVDDVLLQFDSKAMNGVVPTSVESKEKDGKTLQLLTMSGDSEKLEVWIDPQTKLIQSIETKITGGAFVRPGATATYKNTYEYQTHDKALPDSTFVFEPGQRQRVDLMTALVPRPSPMAAGGGGDQPDAAQPQNALVGKPAPQFTLATADGKAVDLKDLQGKVVILDFWASWCGPCMMALPKLHEVAKWALKEELPVTVMTVNVWEIRDPAADSPDARLRSAKATWEKRGFTLPIAMDYSNETAAAYGVQGIPTTVVIRSDGVVHAYHVGASANYVEDLKHEIQEALKAVE